MTWINFKCTFWCALLFLEPARQGTHTCVSSSPDLPPNGVDLARTSLDRCAACVSNLNHFKPLTPDLDNNILTAHQSPRNQARYERYRAVRAARRDLSVTRSRAPAALGPALIDWLIELCVRLRSVLSNQHAFQPLEDFWNISYYFYMAISYSTPSSPRLMFTL